MLNKNLFKALTPNIVACNIHRNIRKKRCADDILSKCNRNNVPAEEGKNFFFIPESL